MKTKSNSLSPAAAVLDVPAALWALDSARQRYSKKVLAQTGLTAPQWAVVRIVREQPGLSAGTLAEALRLDPSTLTRMLRRLEDLDVLRRAVDPEDNRRQVLNLTQKGRRLAQKRLDEGEVVDRALQDVRPEEIRAAMSVFSRLQAHLAQEVAA